VAEKRPAGLLVVPSHPARELDKDLVKAGIPKRTSEGKLDFHACRVAYTTLVIEVGATVKEAQTLLRHSTPQLTMNAYARARDDRLAEVAERVGAAVFGAFRAAVRRTRSISAGGGFRPERHKPLRGQELMPNVNWWRR
jgi:hypothetical protein